MPVVIPAGFRQVTMVHSVPGAHGECDLVFGIQAVGTEEDDLRDFMDVWQDNAVAQFFTTNVTFTFGRCLSGPRPGTPALELAADPLKPTVGAQGSNALPVNNAVLWQLNTGLGGVRFRGRKYLPGVAENIVDNAGDLLPASQAQFQTDVLVFMSQLASAGLTLYLLHGTGISATPAPTEVTDIRVQRKMATQRTRLRG